MGKQLMKLKAVIYALSPFQQKIMTELWKDLPEKIHHKVTENWISTTLLVTPVVGTYWYAQYFKEQEKLEHRFYALKHQLTPFLHDVVWKPVFSLIESVSLQLFCQINVLIS